MKARRILTVLFSALIVLAIGVIAPIVKVDALPGGVGFQEGYFTGIGTPGSGFGDVIKPCVGVSAAVADSSMTNKATFIARILAYYGGCGSSSYNQTRNATGGKFVIQTMRGSRSASVSAADIADWQARINNPAISISWVANASFTVNSGYTGDPSTSIGVADDAFFSAGGNYDSLVFRDSNNGNSIVYQLKANCGNPVGSLSLPVPPTNWSINPSASVSPSSATPGNTITWTHTVTNAGPNATDAVVSYDYKNNSGFPNNSTGGSGTLPSGSGNGASRTFNSTFVPTFADIGKTFCRVTEASPRAKGNNGLIASAPSCATVAAPINPCRPIRVSVPAATTYPAISHTAPNGSFYSAAAKTVPITVSTSNQSWGPFTTPQILDATANHTTGDVYAVTFTETSNHVSGWTDNYVNDLTKPIYGNDYSRPIYGPAPTYTFLGYQQMIVGYQQKYSSTTTNYAGPFTSSGTPFGPCYDYILTSNINGFASKLEPDSIVDITPTVNSASWTQSNYVLFWNTYGTHSKSKPSKWQITKMVIAPNGAFPTAKATINNNVAPCAYFDPTSITTCSVQASSTTTIFSANGNPSPSTSISFTVPDSSAGTKVCFAFSLYPTQSDPLNTSSSWGGGDLWNHATFNPANNCIIIVKKPKTQIWGGDLWSRGAISSSTSVKNIAGNHTFGSWVEYGIFSPLTILGTASGSAFAGSTGLTGNNPICSYSTLTFTSAGATSCTVGTAKGIYQTTHIIPDVEANFPGVGNVITTSSVVPNDLHN